MISFKKNNRGFTLIELMIAMVIGLIVMASIFQVFRSHQKAQTSQQLVVDMVQNARSAITLMKREIRMAGHAPAATDGQDNDNPTIPDGADNLDTDDDYDYPAGFPRFLVAKRDTIRFTMDFLPDPLWCTDGINNDGDTETDEMDECFSNGNSADLNEDITYSLSGTNLMRDDANDGSPSQVLAYDIEAVAFAYAYDLDPGDDDNLLATGADDNVIWAYDLMGFNKLDFDIATLVPPIQPISGPIDLDIGGRSVIRAVKIWLLARTAYPVPNYSDTEIYQVADQAIGPDDYDPRYKHTLLTATVYCRNVRDWN
jgi:type IV pilus assembly protein PilW